MYHLAPTQALGLAAFALAALLAWAAARASKREAAPWRAVALLNGLVAAEIVLKLRFAAEHAAVRAFTRVADYGGRRGPQAIVIALILLAGLASAWLVFTRLGKRGPGARTAALLTVAACVLLGVEAVSLHQVDALLYGHVGPLPLLAWGWLGCGFGTAACAFASIGRR